MLQLDLDLKSA